jgi:hypothetical protein
MNLFIRISALVTSQIYYLTFMINIYTHFCQEEIMGIPRPIATIKITLT